MPPSLAIFFPSSSSSSCFSLVSYSYSYPRHRGYMARSLYKTLVLTSKTTSVLSSSKSPPRLLTLRAQSTQSESAEQRAVQKIEDAIHGIIVRRSAPDWLPFVPGSSYWVPPRRNSYGIADLIDKLANSLTHDQVMSLTTSRGWPSSSFFLLNETSPTEDEEN